MPMKVLIVATNRCRSPLPVIPVGACAIAEASLSAGHEVRLLDLLPAKDPRRVLDATITAFRPDAVALSVRNIDNGEMHRPVSFVAGLRPLVDAIRARTQAPVIIGGSAVSVMPEALLERSGADLAVSGDGCRAFPALLASPRGDGPRILAAPADGSDPLCAPDLRRWIDLPWYRERLAPAPIRSKLGCPLACIHCSYPRIEGRTHRLADPERVAEAVHRQAAAGLRDIEFVDNVFNNPREHAQAICERLAARPPRARLQTLDLHPAHLDDALLRAMARAGFTAIGITVESASDEVLSRLGKGFDRGDVEAAAARVRRRRIPCLWIFMLGAPGETEETVRETLRFASRVIRRGDAAFFNAGVRIYPGTELEGIARREGVLAGHPDDLLEPVFYVSPSISPAWLIDALRRHAAEHPAHMSPESSGVTLVPGLLRMARAIGIRPPLWRHAGRIRGVLRRIGRGRGRGRGW
ncbi:MAG: radical SAM protein [Planctomycetes bacterium]|nr:radical SAM protein [Planctomycetota bacterium]